MIMPGLKRIPLFPEEFDGELFRFRADNSRRIVKTLRMKPGDRLEVFDQSGIYLVELTSITGSRAVAKLLEFRNVSPAGNSRLRVLFSVVRPGPVEEILRHCTELGATDFTPLISRRCAPIGNAPKGRWRTIILSAISQCGREIIPTLEDVRELSHFLETRQPAQMELALSPSPEARPMIQALEEGAPESISLLVGPEGGFTLEEREMALQCGFTPVRLTSGALRTETATIVACGLAALRLGL
jgi:16S rRNA (uracil1498-N3)-methyltransferase